MPAAAEPAMVQLPVAELGGGLFGGTSSWGLYIHIPYCAHVCHYCDFAKTAWFDQQHTERYFRALGTHLSYVVAYLHSTHRELKSIYFGGGTPSLFCAEYQDLFELVRPVMAAGCEVTLEANPNDVTARRLVAWRQLGINRLSLGVQSLHDGHLQTITRQHSAAEARHSIELVATAFQRWNVDLIYGIPEQQVAEFIADLETVTRLGCHQLSLYHLTFEPRTVMGRRHRRQLIPKVLMQPMHAFYTAGREYLQGKGFIHEELSHYLKPPRTTTGGGMPPRSSEHNWNYWQMGGYFGVGAGAHSYIPDEGGGTGLRYAFGPNDRHFKELMPWRQGVGLDSPEAILRRYQATSGLSIDPRDKQSLVAEMVMSSLRTSQGVPLHQLEQLGVRFCPHEEITLQLQRGLIQRRGGFLVFEPQLWLYEHTYIQAMLDSLEVV